MPLTPKEQAALVHFQNIEAEAQAAIAELSTTPPTVPSAAFVYDEQTNQLQYLFTATENGLQSYAWDWGDGGFESHAFPETYHTFRSGGVYTVTLTVTNSSGISNISSQSIIVGVAFPIPPNPPAGEVHAELPRIFIDTSVPPITGTTIHVNSGQDFQTALNNAQLGDAIVLDNAGTWIGNFVLPEKTTGTGWITVMPDLPSSYPTPGTRIGPVAGLPKLVSPNNQGAIATALRAHHFRFIGIEITSTPTITNTGLVRLGSGSETSLAQMPNNIIFDRCYIHGTPTSNVRRGVSLNCAYGSVVDCYISEIHEHGSDSQAVVGWSGPGPFKIFNNYVEAASENINWGGGDPLINGLIPSDIEIRYNHITKKLAWKGANWNVKNLFETKNSNRVLFEGNEMEFCWADGQGGSAVNAKSVNQDQTAPWSCTKDLTFRLNRVRNVGSGFMLTGLDVGASVVMERVTIINNVFEGIDIAPYNGDGRGILVNNNPTDVVIAHNHFLSPTNTLITFGGPAVDPPIRFIFRDNIGHGGQYGVKGPGLGTADTFAAFFSDGKFVGNLVVTLDSVGFPVGNYFPPTISAIGFTSSTDLSLAASSPYKGLASDGGDPGADFAAVMMAVAGVIQL